MRVIADAFPIPLLSGLVRYARGAQKMVVGQGQNRLQPLVYELDVGHQHPRVARHFYRQHHIPSRPWTLLRWLPVAQFSKVALRLSLRSSSFCASCLLHAHTPEVAFLQDIKLSSPGRLLEGAYLNTLAPILKLIEFAPLTTCAARIWL